MAERGREGVQGVPHLGGEHLGGHHVDDGKGHGHAQLGQHDGERARPGRGFLAARDEVVGEAAHGGDDQEHAQGDPAPEPVHEPPRQQRAGDLHQDDEHEVEVAVTRQVHRVDGEALVHEQVHDPADAAVDEPEHEDARAQQLLELLREGPVLGRVLGQAHLLRLGELLLLDLVQVQLGRGVAVGARRPPDHVARLLGAAARHQPVQRLGHHPEHGQAGQADAVAEAQQPAPVRHAPRDAAQPRQPQPPHHVAVRAPAAAHPRGQQLHAHDEGGPGHAVVEHGVEELEHGVHGVVGGERHDDADDARDAEPRQHEGAPAELVREAARQRHPDDASKVVERPYQSQLPRVVGFARRQVPLCHDGQVPVGVHVLPAVLRHVAERDVAPG